MADLRVEVSLPSLGKPYGESETAFVSPMTGKEEKLLFGVTKATQFSDALDEVVKRCLTYPVAPIDLLASDYVYILYKIRENSYGDEYGFTIRCDSCNEQYRRVLKISEVPIKLLPDSWKEPFEVKLPVAGNVVHLRLYRHKDDRSVADYVIQQRKLFARRGIGEILGDPAHTYRLTKNIVSIDGIKDDDIPKFVDDMYAKDISEIRNAIADNSCGFEDLLEETCPNCGTEYEIALPFDREFFRPNTRKSK